MTEAKQDGHSMLFISGMIIGAVTAVLLSPKNGQEMRSEIKEKARTMKDKFENKKDEIENKKDEIANKAENKIDETQSRMQRSKDKGMV